MTDEEIEEQIEREFNDSTLHFHKGQDLKVSDFYKLRDTVLKNRREELRKALGENYE